MKRTNETYPAIMEVMQAMLGELRALKTEVATLREATTAAQEDGKALRLALSAMQMSAEAAQQHRHDMIRRAIEASHRDTKAMIAQLIAIRGPTEPSQGDTMTTRKFQDQANATAALEDLGNVFVPPHVSTVIDLIARSAEVIRIGRGAHSPLHRWAREGQLELVKALLETPNIINFRIPDEEGNTPFHSVLCGPAKSDEAVREMMGAMLDRLDSHMGDTGEDRDDSGLTLWEVKNAAGCDILHLAIATGHLSVVYPLLKDRPYYRDRVSPIALHMVPNDDDWNCLEEREQQRMDLLGTGGENGHPRRRTYENIDKNAHIEGCSRRLHGEVFKASSSTIDLSVVTWCVWERADILYLPEDGKFPTLHWCIRNGHGEALKVLLGTPRNVDFTVRDKYGYVPLHYVACRCTDMAKEMLMAIRHRLSTHPNDRVDWSQKDSKDGWDFLGWAAYCGRLADLYPVVKCIPFYMNAPKPLLLTYRARDEDWARLSQSERSELARPRQS